MRVWRAYGRIAAFEHQQRCHNSHGRLNSLPRTALEAACTVRRHPTPHLRHCRVADRRPARPAPFATRPHWTVLCRNLRYGMYPR
eukprot:5839997-Pleurochrysis_carterae.AAC.1